MSRSQIERNLDKIVEEWYMYGFDFSEKTTNSLKIANTFLGSNDKSLTKLKINNLIKELDKCILSLSS